MIDINNLVTYIIISKVNQSSIEKFFSLFYLFILFIYFIFLFYLYLFFIFILKMGSINK